MVTPYNAESLASSIADDLSTNIAGKVVLTTGVSPGGTITLVPRSDAHKLTNLRRPRCSLRRNHRKAQA